MIKKQVDFQVSVWWVPEDLEIRQEEVRELQKSGWEVMLMAPMGVRKDETGTEREILYVALAKYEFISEKPAKPKAKKKPGPKPKKAE